MMGEQTRTEAPFYYFRLEDQIAEDHLLRQLDPISISASCAND